MRKLVYRHGELFDPFSGERVGRWVVAGERIFPADYRVVLETRRDGVVIICEDETAVWLEEKGRRHKLSAGGVKLPSFEGHPHAKVPRQEILVSIVKGLPLPNIFVYEKPWYRDGAMVGRSLERTGNLDPVKDRIMSIREPFDYNDGGVAEPDNPGQVLYMVLPVAGSSYPESRDGQAEDIRVRKGAAHIRVDRFRRPSRLSEEVAEVRARELGRMTLSCRRFAIPTARSSGWISGTTMQRARVSTRRPGGTTRTWDGRRISLLRQNQGDQVRPGALPDDPGGGGQPGGLRRNERSRPGLHRGTGVLSTFVACGCSWHCYE